MATEPAACPVCGESFAEPPARCFRCETDLQHWWPLDQSLRALAGIPSPDMLPSAREAVREESASTRPRRVWVVPVILMGGLLGTLFLYLESTRPPASESAASVRARPTSPAVAAPVPPAPPVQSTPRPTLRYVVQPGDSLWRIAASLKGDGRRWPELLEGGEGVDPARLRPGQVLQLRLEGDGPGDLPAARRP